MERKDKTKFTLEHAQIFYQTYAEILAEIYAPNIEVKAVVKEKEENKWKENTWKNLKKW